MAHHESSRRNTLKSLVYLGAATALGRVPLALAAGLPPLDPADPQAKALGFASDSSKVDAASNPTHKPEQKCGTCAQFQGKPGDATGGCNIFAGKSVPQNGWCRVWAQKA